MTIMTNCEKSKVKKNAQLEGEMRVFRHFITKAGTGSFGAAKFGRWMD